MRVKALQADRGSVCACKGAQAVCRSLFGAICSGSHKGGIRAGLSIVAASNQRAGLIQIMRPGLTVVEYPGCRDRPCSASVAFSMNTLLPGTVAAIVLSGQVWAQELAYGAEIYQRYCAVCHGPGAAGDGEMVPFLRLKMPDLTRLSERNGGEFPMSRTIRAIDGRSKLRGHVGPMPYFAPLFARETAGVRGDYEAAVDANGRILLLAKYLESIQNVEDSAPD